MLIIIKKTFIYTSIFLLIAILIINFHLIILINNMLNRRVEEKNKQLPFEKDIERIEFKTDEGLKLSSWHLDADNPEAIIIFLHGIHDTASSYLEFSAFLNQYNYEIFNLDMRARGFSEGEKIGAAYTEHRDVSALIDLIKDNNKYADKDIFLIGHSMGGSTAINTAAYKNEIAGVITLNAYQSYEELIVDILRKNKFPNFLREIYRIFAEVIIKNRFGDDFKEKSPLNQISKAEETPFLIIQAENDKLISLYQAENLQDNAKKSELIVMENANHNNITHRLIQQGQNKYFKIILNFLENN